MTCSMIIKEGRTKIGQLVRVFQIYNRKHIFEAWFNDVGYAFTFLDALHRGLGMSRTRISYRIGF